LALAIRLAIDKEAPDAAMNAEANTKLDRPARASEGRSLSALFVHASVRHTEVRHPSIFAS